jgi:uncharacterized membrane protein
VSAYRLALFLHVLGAIIFFAGMTVAGLAWESARRRQDPREAAALLRLARSGALLVGSGTAVVLFAGLWLVDLRDEGWPA